MRLQVIFQSYSVLQMSLFSYGQDIIKETEISMKIVAGRGFIFVLFLATLRVMYYVFSADASLLIKETMWYISVMQSVISANGPLAAFFTHCS